MKKLLIGLGILAGVLLGGSAADAYSYSYQTQTPYATVNNGQTVQASLTIRNNGPETWCKACPTPTRLGTSNPLDRGSGFQAVGQGWISPNRIEMQEATVAPGQDAHFVFTVKANEQFYLSGLYREYFRPVVDGVTWMQDIGIYWDYTVPAPVGIFFFNWYNAQTGDHWAWGPNSAVIDNPLFDAVNGPYNSDDPATIRSQLNRIRDMGVNFVSIDWWPNQPYLQQAGTQVINIIKAEYPTLKFAMFLEPGNPWEEPVPQSFYDAIYNQYANDPQYFRWKGKMYMGTFYYRISGNDPRFNTITYSNNRPQYPDYWAIPASSKGRITAIIPRYDDRHLCQAGATRACQAHDPTYAGDLMGHQFNAAMGYRANTDLLMITAWNEYHERTNIEPHTNPDSGVSATYSYDRFLQFILTRWRT